MEIIKNTHKAPYLVDIEEGKTYAWCQCGQSNKQPFCDGSHKGTDKRPKMFTAQKTGKVSLCGCKETSNQPFCDGTHKKL
jgi:CDGSH-type Zn-finger protein